MNEAGIYQRIGEFVVTFQWLEHLLRQIGWYILDPNRHEWPPTALRNLRLVDLIDKVDALFAEALPKCDLSPELEAELLASFAEASEEFHRQRHARNKILHAAFMDLKGGGEVIGLLRVDVKLGEDPETGGKRSDIESLSPESFADQFRELSRIASILNRCHLQLIHRLPTEGH